MFCFDFVSLQTKSYYIWNTIIRVQYNLQRLDLSYGLYTSEATIRLMNSKQAKKLGIHLAILTFAVSFAFCEVLKWSTAECVPFPFNEIFWFELIYTICRTHIPLIDCWGLRLWGEWKKMQQATNNNRKLKKCNTLFGKNYGIMLTQYEFKNQ